MTGGLAQATDRKGRRKAKRAAIDNIYKQALKQVVQNQRHGVPPPTVGELLKQLDTRVFRLMADEIGLTQEMVVEALHRAGAIEKGGEAMEEKKAKVKTGTVWGRFKRRWQLWLGLIFVCLVMALAVLVALEQEQVLGALLLGYMGGVISGLLYNRQRGK